MYSKCTKFPQVSVLLQCMHACNYVFDLLLWILRDGDIKYNTMHILCTMRSIPHYTVHYTCNYIIPFVALSIERTAMTDSTLFSDTLLWMCIHQEQLLLSKLQETTLSFYDWLHVSHTVRVQVESLNYSLVTEMGRGTIILLLQFYFTTGIKLSLMNFGSIYFPINITM